ncbi:translation initiation factor IF-3 [Actinobacillus equuli]|nr:translation initiation factor IF-3 [Actinobacillus equuli]
MQIKEIKFRPGTDDGDYQIKLRSILRFLEDGDKVKITVRFRGREMAHQDIGLDVLERVKTDTAEVAVVESAPGKLEGRQAVMVIAPKKK